MKDFEDKINKGVNKSIAVKLEDEFKYWLIYKKKFYQWGMSPLALLAYLIFY